MTQVDAVFATDPYLSDESFGEGGGCACCAALGNATSPSFRVVARFSYRSSRAVDREAYSRTQDPSARYLSVVPLVVPKQMRRLDDSLQPYQTLRLSPTFCPTIAPNVYLIIVRLPIYRLPFSSYCCFQIIKPPAEQIG